MSGHFHSILSSTLGEHVSQHTLTTLLMSDTCPPAPPLTPKIKALEGEGDWFKH